VVAVAANHPRGPAATCLDAEVVIATGAEVICGSPTTNFQARVLCLVAAAAAANHPRVPAATYLGAEVVIATTAGVICSSPAANFFCWV
jgi:hypothetical protein